MSYVPTGGAKATQTAILFQDEGVDQGTVGDVEIVDFTGAGVTATESANTLTVDIPGIPDGKYATIYVNGNSTATTVSASSTWYQITVFNADGIESGADADHTNDHITIDETASYYVSGSFSFSASGGAGDTFEIQAFKNNGVTALPNLHLERKVGTAGDIGSGTFSGLVALTAGDTLEVWTQNTSGTDDITIRDGSLSVLKVPGVGAAPGIADGATLVSGLTFPNTGLHISDTNASHDLIVAPGSDLTADRTLTVTTGDADRTLTINASTTLGGGTHSGTNTGDQTLYNQTIEDEGTPVTQRGTVNFTGAGVSVADTGGKTTVTIAGGAGQAFPVGAVYINVTGVNPATELGYGTWSAFGAGRVLVGYDSGDTDFDTVEETGGAKIVAAAGSNAAEALHTHSVTSNVTVGNHVFTQPTAADESSHTHSVNATGTAAVKIGTGAANAAAQSHTHTTAAGSAHTHTISGGAVDAHAVTNNAVTSAAGSSHTHVFTGSATSVVQPYIVVHMWKRTA